MLLSNQKYLMVKYEFSSEFYTYTKAITSFIYDIINAYDDATLSNIKRFDELEIKHDEDK